MAVRDDQIEDRPALPIVRHFFVSEFLSYIGLHGGKVGGGSKGTNPAAVESRTWAIRRSMKKRFVRPFTRNAEALRNYRGGIAAHL
jgi:hypothetical protein